MDTIDHLIELLFDEAEEFGARDDAAMDLGDHDDDRALEALIRFVTGPTTEDEKIYLVPSCSESIAHIWLKRNLFDRTTYSLLPIDVQKEILGTMKQSTPELLTELL